jgi:hypothetical protein
VTLTKYRSPCPTIISLRRPCPARRRQSLGAGMCVNAIAHSLHDRPRGCKRDQHCVGENELSGSVALLPPTMPPDLQAPMDFRDAGVSNLVCGMDDGSGLCCAPSPGLPMFMSNPRIEVSRNRKWNLDDSQMRGMNVSEVAAPSTGKSLDGPLLDVSPSRTSHRGDENGSEREQAETNRC